MLADVSDEVELTKETDQTDDLFTVLQTPVGRDQQWRRGSGIQWDRTEQNVVKLFRFFVENVVEQ